MPIPSDAHLERIPLDGRDLAEEVETLCKRQADLKTPRRLVASTTVVTNGIQEVILIFEQT